jgi:hypothetical protein
MSVLAWNTVISQPVITNNNELNMKSQTENAELLKKSLEENLALDLKEANKLKDRMEKFLASDFKEAYLIRDSLKRGIEPESFRCGHGRRKRYSMQKKGKNISLQLDSDKRMVYKESETSQDSLIKKDEDFLRIALEPTGKIGGYIKQEQNKKTTISLYCNQVNDSELGFSKTETTENPDINRKSEFYPNGKLKRTGELGDRGYGITDGSPVGTWYLYNKEGILIETSEYEYDDSLYEFTREDVIEYINKECIKDTNPDSYNTVIIKTPQYTVNGEIKEKAKWWIHIDKRDFYLISILLDAKTGEKLHEHFSYPHSDVITNPNVILR